jgi:hypothetical protein
MLGAKVVIYQRAKGKRIVTKRTQKHPDRFYPGETGC